MKVIPEKIVETISDAYNRLHSAGLQSIDAYDKKITYPYGTKQDIPVGLVIGTQRNENGELLVHQRELLHTLLVASSGLGKSQGFIMNNLFCANKNASYIIADVKGELLQTTYYRFCETHGKENVHVFNFRSPEHSECSFNPFFEIARRFVLVEKSSKNDDKKHIQAEALTDLQKLVNEYFPVTNTQQPEWQESAQQFIYAIFLGLIEDCVSEKIKPEQVNLHSVINVWSMFDRNADGEDWGDNGFFKRRSKYSPARKKAETVLCTSSRGTRSSFYSVVNLYVETYNSPKVLRMMNGKSFDFTIFKDKPQVVFVVYDLTDEITKDIVNVFFEHTLNTFVAIYNESQQALKYPLLVFLDEFTSLKPKKIYQTLISTGRGMGIYLQLAVQSLAQINASYGEEATAIKENCNLKIVLGTNEYETAREFIKEGGETLVLSKNHLRRGEFYEEKEYRISVEKVMFEMKKGSALIKTLNTPVFESVYQFAYETPEFNRYPKFNQKEIKPKEKREEPLTGLEDFEKMQIEKTRETLQRRRNEILKKLQGNFDESEQ